MRRVLPWLKILLCVLIALLFIKTWQESGKRHVEPQSHQNAPPLPVEYQFEPEKVNLLSLDEVEHFSCFATGITLGG